jgi:hypothetical protein
MKIGYLPFVRDQLRQLAAAAVNADQDKITKLERKAHRPGVYQCNEGACREQFTVTVGTVFERSKIPLTKWLAGGLNPESGPSAGFARTAATACWASATNRHGF